MQVDGKSLSVGTKCKLITGEVGTIKEVIPSDPPHDPWVVLAFESAPTRQESANRITELLGGTLDRRSEREPEREPSQPTEPGR